MPIAVLDIYHQFQFETLRLLTKKPDLEVGYCISGTPRNFHGDKNIIKAIQESILKGVPTDTIEKFLFPEQLIELINTPYALSNELLDAYSDLEVMFLKLTDRSASTPISVNNRRKYYHLLLNYFLDIIENHNINHVLCFDTPHSFFSNLFYNIALKKSIPVTRIEYHYFSNYCLVTDMPAFPDIPKGYKEEKDIESILAELPATIKSQISEKNSFVDSYVSKETRRLAGPGLKGDLKLYGQYLFKYIGNIAIGLMPFLYREHIHHFTSLHGNMSELRYRIMINQSLKKTYNLAKHYKSIATIPDFSRPYIYFGLHMQPEKTTTPLGGHMDSQLAAITIISQALPENWTLYVKEHPNQYNLRKVANQNTRDAFFYRSIEALNNVKLVHLNIPSEDLITGAKLVGTITGTLGWEALTKGVPALIFGDAYYRACRAVGFVDDLDSCKRHISKLQALTQEEIRLEIVRYLNYYHEKGILVHSSNWENKIAHSDISRTEQIENLSKAISQSVNQ